MKPFCITFAGPAGCSKTPVAQYLSCMLNLPIMSNDVVRTEVREDHMSSELDEEDYLKRKVDRIKDLAGRHVSFVYDASQDRHWQRFLSHFEPDAYDVGVISFDLSPAFYKALLLAKRYEQSFHVADKYIAQHQAFVDTYSDAVICSITDDSFRDRLQVALLAAQQFIDDRK